MVLPDDFQEGLITELRPILQGGRNSLTFSKSFRSGLPMFFLDSSAHSPVQASHLNGSKVQCLKQFEKNTDTRNNLKMAMRWSLQILVLIRPDIKQAYFRLK